MSRTWRKFIVLITIVFGALFIYIALFTGAKAYIGTADIITTFIGVYSLLYFTLKNPAKFESLGNSPEDKSGRLAKNVVKVAMIIMAIIIIYILYLLLKNV